MTKLRFGYNVDSAKYKTTNIVLPHYGLRKLQMVLLHSPPRKGLRKQTR